MMAFISSVSMPLLLPYSYTRHMSWRNQGWKIERVGKGRAHLHIHPQPLGRNSDGGDEDQGQPRSRPTESRQGVRGVARGPFYDVEAPADIGGTTSTGQCTICNTRGVTLPSSSPTRGP